MSRNFTPDQSLVDRLLLNDTEAFEELYHRYWHSLYNYCAKKVNSQKDAVDIVRNIFIELWEQRQSLPVTFSISNHLYTAVRKSVIKCLNQKLSVITETGEVENNFTPSFSMDALRPARIPVHIQYTSIKPAEVKRQQIIEKNEHSYNPLQNIKWLFQLVNAKLHSHH